ncbi:MAG: ABC transporter substrate-binding protein [Candidatus Dormibacteraceae bacterium]
MTSIKSAGLAAAALIVGVAGLSGCGTGGSGGSSNGTLVIGAPLALTGPIAAQATEMQNSMALYLSQHGNKLGGIPVKVIYQDTQGDPNQAVSKTRLVIQNNGADLIVGGALAPESLAIRGVVVAAKIAYVSPISSADDLTQRKRSPLIARTNMTSSQPNMPFGAYAYNTLGYHRVAIITQDYGYGWESAGGFAYGFQKSGGQIAAKVYVPLGTTDWAPYVHQLPTNVDAIYALPVGSGVAQFARAYIDAGLKAKIPLIGGPDLADEDALQAAGNDLVGVVQVHDYNPNESQTQPYATAYQRAYHIVPSYWGESTYTSLMWIDRTIAAYRKGGASASATVNWIRTNPAAFISEMRGVPLPDAPRGPLTLDKYNNAVLNLYIVKVIEKNGKPYRETIDTIPSVSQFWNVAPATFLAQPVFSRTFPG